MTIEDTPAFDLTQLVIPFGINVSALRKHLDASEGHTLESFLDDHLLPAMRESVLKRLRKELEG